MVYCFILNTYKKTFFNFQLSGLFFLLALQFSSCSFTQKSCGKMLRKAAENGPYDAVIVPGIPYDNGQWSRTMKGRVYWSYILYKNGIAKNIIYSGSAVYSPYVEGKIMALYAVALGIPAENVFSEQTAEHSTENLYYSFHLGKKNGFKKMALATDPFQSKLLKKFSKRMDLNVPMIPMVFDSLESIVKVDPVIDDQQAFRPDFVSILERESFWERLKGTRGKKIKLVTND